MRRRNEFYSCSTMKAECTLSDFHRNEAKKKLLATKNSKLPILKKILRKFLVWVLGFDVSSKTGNNCIFVFLGWFWALSDALIFSINTLVPLYTAVLCLLLNLMHQTLLTQGPITELFVNKCWDLVVLKISVFLSQPIWKISFCFILMRVSQRFLITKDGSKFWYYPGWVSTLIHNFNLY